MWQTIGEWWGWFSGLVMVAQSAWAFLLSTALVAAAGAYFGALGAQRSINRENRLRRRIDLIMAANGAQSLTTVIFNQAASLKKQYYLPIRDNWRRQRDTAIAATRSSPSVPIEVRIEFITPPAIQFPTGSLADIIYRRLALNGRPLAAFSEIVQAEHTLTQLVEEYQAFRAEMDGKPASFVIPRYLALETPGGGGDDRYKDLVENFVTVVDDLIFFSDILGKDLISYGGFVRRQATRREKRALPEVNQMGQLVEGHEHLIPEDPKHAEWLRHHEWTITEATRWWRRVW